MKRFSIRSRFATLTVALAAMALSACDSTEGGGGLAATPLTATGSFSGKIDNADWSVDYTGLKASATMTHRINKDPGGLACVPSLAIEVAKADGTCKLELKYEAGFAGE